jgi:hypothetical protein
MSIGSQRIAGFTFLRLCLLTGALMLLALVTAGSARAAEEPFTLQFDQSAIEAGPIGGLDLEGLSGPSTIEGTIDEQGNIKIPKGKFKLPVLDVSTIAQSLIPGVELPVAIEGFMGIEQPATGTFDRQTGQMEITTKAGLWVSIDIQQVLAALDGLGVDISGSLGALGPLIGLLGDDLTCGFSPMDVTFTTEATSLGEGERFSKGLKGPGALTAEWSQLGPFAGKTKVLVFDVCTLVRNALPGLLSGIGGGALGGFDLGSLLAGLDDLDLGPSSLTITRTLDETPPPPVDDPELKMTVAPKRLGSASSGTSYRITVRNLGKSPASRTRLCAGASRKAVRGARCFRLGTIAPGKSKKATFKLRLKRNAPRSSYKVTFRMTAAGGISSVKPAWLVRGSR